MDIKPQKTKIFISTRFGSIRYSMDKTPINSQRLKTNRSFNLSLETHLPDYFVRDSLINRVLAKSKGKTMLAMLGFKLLNRKCFENKLKKAVYSNDK